MTASIHSKSKKRRHKTTTEPTMRDINSNTEHQVCSTGMKENTHEMPHCSVIGSKTVIGMPACPCCNVQMKDGRQTVGETRVQNQHESLFAYDTGDDTDSSNSDMDEQDHMMPGILSDGVAYTITQNLVQGWVHKKGTGMDWLGSRSWKPRWAVLSLAKIVGHETEIPLLQIYWYSSSPSPTTVIRLDSAVVLPEDDKDRSKWNCFRFTIRHVKKSVDEDFVQVSRVFSCPREGRDAWCEAINKTLLEYEKKKAHARKTSAYSPLSPARKQPMVAWATGDAFPSAMMQSTIEVSPVMTPPTSPKSQPKHLPRTEPTLVGETLLAQALD